LKRKLLLLNVVLIALIVAVGWRLRREWLDSKAREQAILKAQVRPPAPPSISPLPKTQPVTPTNYLDIAQKMLLSKDRNPAVVVETAPPPAVKPLPPLPVMYGIMDLGDGPTALMSDKAGSRHHGVRPGEKVGEYTLVALNDQEVTLEFEGRTVVKKPEELKERSQQPSSGADAGARTAPPPGTAAPPISSGRPEPGVDVAPGIRACQPGDSSAPGTVANGMRKVVTQSPFGDTCRWEAVK